MIHRAFFALIFSVTIASAVTAPEGDNILWYDQPATAWEQALPIGNGHLGAMVFGGTTHERIQFNEHTVWTGKPHSRKPSIRRCQMDRPPNGQTVSLYSS